MRITVDKRDPTPLKEQIRRAISAAVAEGALNPGDRTPSINAIAKDCGVARETVRLSLETLVGEGILTPRRGSGFFVAPRRGRALRVALMGRLDGVYLKPAYDALVAELGSKASIFAIDGSGDAPTVRGVVERLAHHQAIDALLVIPIRGLERETDALLRPFRRRFRVGWLDRAPNESRDATFLCDYRVCVELALRRMIDSGCDRFLYFTRNPEDDSVFSLMRRAFVEFTDDDSRHGFASDWRTVREVAPDGKERLGVFAETDAEAVFLQTRLIQAGSTVPDDVMIVSCDDTPLASLVVPKIPSVDPGFADIGAMAAKWIKETVTDSKEPFHFVATPTLRDLQVTIPGQSI